MRNLHLAPKFEKIYFYTTENFGVKKKKILIFENDRKTRNTNSLFGKIFWHMYSLISWNTYSIVYITWNVVPEAEFNKKYDKATQKRKDLPFTVRLFLIIRTLPSWWVVCQGGPRWSRDDVIANTTPFCTAHTECMHLSMARRGRKAYAPSPAHRKSDKPLYPSMQDE